MSLVASETPNATARLDHLSYDAVVFAVLWTAQFALGEFGALVPASRTNNVSLIMNLYQFLAINPIPALLLFVLASYLAADLCLRGRRQFGLKLAAIMLSIGAFVIVPTLLAMLYRQQTSPNLYIHDGAIQIEEAIKFLLSGRNPYAESYASTPMALWPFNEEGLTTNPALDHFVYLPFTVIFSVPFYVVSQLAIGWYDQRIVYLAALALGIPMILLAASSPRARLLAVMVFALNPLLGPFLAEGRNDIVSSFWLIAMIVCLQRGWLAWAAVMVAFALATKQTTWFLVPFFLFYTLQWERSLRWHDLLHHSRILVPAALLLALILVPFVLWDYRAFADDVIGYQTGTAVGANYPIKSLGLGGLAMGLGWIPGNTTSFPFSWFQIVLGGIMILGLLCWQSRKNTLSRMLLSYALCLFVVGFFSRVFNNNHLGFLLTWLLLPSLLESPDLKLRHPATEN